MDISVIVPTYNRAGLIEETLHSIVSQTLRPAQVIVVDDGSQDHTERVVRDFGRSAEYLRIENSGECRARNVGVQASSATWVAFCDSDDLWRPDKLMRQAELLEKAPDVEYCFTNFAVVTASGWSATTKFDSAPAGYWELPRRQLGPDLLVVEGSMFEKLLVHQPIFPSTLLMRRSFFERVGRWNEPLGRTPSVDLEFHLRCVADGRVGVVSAPVAGIRKHGGNFSGNPLRTTVGEVAILRYVLEHHRAAQGYAAAIGEQIKARCAMAAEGAFAAGNFALVRELLAGVPPKQRSRQLRMKSRIARLPAPLGRAARSMAVNARQLLSTVRPGFGTGQGSEAHRRG